MRSPASAVVAGLGGSVVGRRRFVGFHGGARFDRLEVGWIGSRDARSDRSSPAQGHDPRDQPVGQVVAGLERLGLRAGADQVERVPPLRSVWRSLATVRSARLMRQASSARRISSSGGTSESSLNPTR